MPTQEERSRVRVHGQVFDLTKVGEKRLSSKDVQILAEAAILRHLEADETFTEMKKQIETLQKESACDHPRRGWELTVGPPRPSRYYIFRMVTCTCRECGKKLFEMSGTEEVNG